MVAELTKDRVLVRYRMALDAMYGDRIERVVLFGSHARGDAHSGSNYDVAVFLRDMEDHDAEMDLLADLSTSVIEETFVHAMPYPTGSYSARTSDVKCPHGRHRSVKPESAAFLERQHVFQLAEWRLVIAPDWRRLPLQGADAALKSTDEAPAMLVV